MQWCLLYKTIGGLSKTSIQLSLNVKVVPTHKVKFKCSALTLNFVKSTVKVAVADANKQKNKENVLTNML